MLQQYAMDLFDDRFGVGLGPCSLAKQPVCLVKQFSSVHYAE